MTVDARLERLYRQVELVRGAGNRKRGRLCIMSFVAFLAEEHHTDNPCTASVLIRQFAIIVNDEMPDHLRQQLKPFAPRIIGTRDGQDRLRAELLMNAARLDILPRIAVDFGEDAQRQANLRRACGDLPKMEVLIDLRDKAASLVLHARSAAGMSGQEELASILARLLTHCAKTATDPACRDWYWLKAIELLDRLCDVGPDRPQPQFQPERLASLEAFLKRREDVQRRKTRVAAALVRARSLIPALW